MTRPTYRTVYGDWYGRPKRYDLTYGEWRLYDAAIERGYFVSSRKCALGRADEAYHASCFNHHRPFVAVYRCRRTCMIAADLHPVSWWLTDDAQDEVRALFRLAGWVRGYVETGTLWYRGVPLIRAGGIANRLLDLLRAARGPWERHQATLPVAEDVDG